jgi:hypothetical protein
MFLAILALVVGIFAFMAIVIAQNASVTEVTIASEHEANVMLSLEHAARRHGPIVYAVNDFCKKDSGNAQFTASKMFEDGQRNAFVCFFPEDK